MPNYEGLKKHFILFIALVGDMLHRSYTQTQIDRSDVEFRLLPVLSTFLGMLLCKPGITAGSFSL